MPATELDKPLRRRSSATEELVGETFILDDSARPKAFDDPPLDHLSLNASGVRPKTPVDCNGFPILEQAGSLSVVKVAASSPPSNIVSIVCLAYLPWPSLPLRALSYGVRMHAWQG